MAKNTQKNDTLSYISSVDWSMPPFNHFPKKDSPAKKPNSSKKNTDHRFVNTLLFPFTALSHFFSRTVKQLDPVFGFFAKLGNKIKENVKNALHATSQFFNSAASKFKSFCFTIATNFSSFFSNLFSKLNFWHKKPTPASEAIVTNLPVEPRTPLAVKANKETEKAATAKRILSELLENKEKSPSQIARPLFTEEAEIVKEAAPQITQPLFTEEAEIVKEAAPQIEIHKNTALQNTPKPSISNGVVDEDGDIYFDAQSEFDESDQEYKSDDDENEEFFDCSDDELAAEETPEESSITNGLRR